MRISFWTRLLDLISPRLCVVCGQRLGVTEQTLCASCNLHLPRTDFAQDAWQNPMARLFWGLLPVERAAALFYYEAGSESARILYELKYHNHPEVGLDMGRMMGRELAAQGFFEGVDALVPVPLARRRQWQRGYNQSLMLAQGIAEATGLPIRQRVVGRTVFRGSQTSKHRWERQQNVADVFRLLDADAIRGQHLLLVDDVVTTGATMTACARQLLQAGGVTVSILSLGFVKS